MTLITTGGPTADFLRGEPACPQSRSALHVVMDPIDDIKPHKDTTLAMLLAAQRRGWKIHYLELRAHLAPGWRGDGPRARICRCATIPHDWFTRGEPVPRRLGDFDAILMRKDPPFDTEYIYSTYILERAELQGALVVNRPQGLRDMNEKVYTAWFPECCAPTLISRDMPDMHAFLREHGRIVCKPLHGMGGRSIFVDRTRRQECERGLRNAHGLRQPLCDRATLYP